MPAHPILPTLSSRQGAPRDCGVLWVRSAASKWGHGDRGLLLDESSLDVRVDLAAAFPAAVAALSPEAEVRLRAAILAAADAALA